MSLRKLLGASVATAAFASFAWAPVSEAAMLPLVSHAPSHVQHVDCAVGFHLGPIGSCVIETDDGPAPAVIEHRDADVGCETNTVKRMDSDGNSETRTKTNC